jgi:hypothetical protein
MAYPTCRSLAAAPVGEPESPVRDRFRRFGQLPLRARLACVVLLSCGLGPPAAFAGAAIWGWPGERISAHPGLVNVIACCVALAALLVFERPSSASPVAYVRQVRTRFLELQSTFDADGRRRPGEGKETDHGSFPLES